MKLRIALIALVAACGGDKVAPMNNTLAGGKPTEPILTADYPLDGGANGLLWDAASKTLYLTDDKAHSLLSFDDAHACCTARRSLPAALVPDKGVSLGDMIKLDDGTILTTSFGFGSDGTVFSIPPAGAPTKVPNLAPDKMRIGIARTNDGRYYEAYFSGKPHVGNVAQFDPASGKEVELIKDSKLHKLVGLVAMHDALFVAQQDKKDLTANAIFKVAVPSGEVTQVAANLPSADALLILPNGDFLTSGTAGISRVTQEGTVTAVNLGGTFGEIYGIAYDDEMHRVFFIERGAVTGEEHGPRKPDALHIRPYTP
ncbi:MAG TPA: hypothetical protein VGM90_10795 [Kofleriaceae bacterium]|jgi:hypothetical protein